MTYDQFLDHVHKTYMAQEPSMDFRLGQIYFNELLLVRPAIAEKIRGSMLDPFYKERITNVVSDFVRERW